jgi:hypothetical protein
VLKPISSLLGVLGPLAVESFGFSASPHLAFPLADRFRSLGGPMWPEEWPIRRANARELDFSVFPVPCVPCLPWLRVFSTLRARAGAGLFGGQDRLHLIAKAGTTGARRRAHDANARSMTYATGPSTFCVIDGKCWPTNV